MCAQAAPVYAQDGAISVSPASAELRMSSQSKPQSVSFAYTNNSQQLVQLQIEVVDFNHTKGGSLRLDGQESGSFSYSLASFLSPDASTLVIKPGEKKTLRVAVRDRESLSPGGHYAAVIARMQSNGPNRANAKVEPSLSTMVLVHKTGGERFNLSLSDSTWPNNSIEFSFPRTFQLTFLNEGNVHLVPYAAIVVRDMFGRVTHRGAVNESSLRVFPESRRYIPASMHSVLWSLPVGINTLSVNGNDSLHKTTFSHSASFVYIEPWFILLVICLVQAALWSHNMRRKNRRK
jgi:hypothetical protein